jgi:hypothetical protein
MGQLILGEPGEELLEAELPGKVIRALRAHAGLEQ